MATSSTPAPSSSFVDIQKVVEDWAWTKYDDSPTRKQRTLREKQRTKDKPYIGLAFDWSGCTFQDETVWSPLADLEAAQTVNKDVNVLFETEFTNNTFSPQTYTLKIEKTTSSTCCTEVESGITKGYELGVSLKFPSEVLEMNAGYKREVTLTKRSGDSFEETLNWGAESEILVDKKSIAHAQLVVKEKKQMGDFEILTRAGGYVGVTFTNLRDNNSYLKRADGNISYIVTKFLAKKQKIGEVYPQITVDEDREIVTFRTKGSCKFRYGIKQEVVVNQKKIEN